MVCKYKAFNRYYDQSNTSEAFELADTLFEQLDKVRINPNKENTLLWRLASTNQAAGILENAVKYYKRYLANHGFKIGKRHNFLILLYYFFPHKKLKTSQSFASSKYDRFSIAIMCIIDFVSFQDKPLTILKNVTLAHQINLQSSKKSHYKGFTYLFIAFYYYPLVKERGTKKFIRFAEEASANSEANLADFCFLKTHYYMYSKNWASYLKVLEHDYNASILDGDHVVAARISMLKCVILLDSGQAHQVLIFLQNEVNTLIQYLPIWFRSWINQLRYSIYLELFHPSKLIFIKQDKIPHEIKAGAYLFFSHAEASLGNYHKSLEYLQLVLLYFSQMQFLNQSFTICIKSFVETPIILYSNGYISKKIFKKFIRCARFHGKFVYRSKPLIDGYEGIINLLSSRPTNGRAILEQACQDAVIRGNYSANRLFRLHLLYLYGTKVELHPQPFEGELVRVQAIWKNSIHQAHPDFLSIL